MDMTFEVLQRASLAGSNSFKQWSSFDEVCYCLLYFKDPTGTYTAPLHILNTDLVNYHLCLEPFKKLTLSLMQFNGKQTTCQHTYSACMCGGLKSTKVSADGIGWITPRMRMR